MGRGIGAISESQKTDQRIATFRLIYEKSSSDVRYNEEGKFLAWVERSLIQLRPGTKELAPHGQAVGRTWVGRLTCGHYVTRYCGAVRARKKALALALE